MNQSLIDKNILLITPTNKLPTITDLSFTRSVLSDNLHTKGALLFRGFHIDSATKFKEVALLFTNNLMSDNGEHIPAKESTRVFTPVNYPSNEKLLWHNENSFNASWPLMIMFGCTTPAKTGGETPIVDSRKMLAKLDPAVIDEFSTKGVMYVRTHGFGLGLPWQKVYRTDNKLELEQLCKRKSIQFEWKKGAQLITKQIRPAIIKHPLTGELSWFNQAQHWHPACLAPEVRKSLMDIFTLDTLPRNCRFGDGSLIPDEMMQHILQTYNELEISFTWKQGDVMVLDNVLFAHGRNPYFGERNLLVAMGMEYSYQ